MKRIALFLLCLLLLFIGRGTNEEDLDPPQASFYPGRIIKVVGSRFGDTLFLCEEEGFFLRGKGLLDRGDIVWLETVDWLTDEEGAPISLDGYRTGDRVEVDIRHYADTSPFASAPVYAIRLIEAGDGTIVDEDLHARLTEADITPVGVRVGVN